jgi:S1-C subfamily serine protease
MHPVPSNHGSVPETRRTDVDFFAPDEPASSSSAVGDPPPAPSQPPHQEPPRDNKTEGGGGFGRKFLPLALVALLAGGAGAAGVAALDDGGTNTVTIQQAAPASSGGTSQTRTIVQPTVAGQLSVGQIYDEAGPGVVRVEQQNGQGSGFVIDEDGYIVTNAHVVEGAQTVYVSFSNNDRVEARVVGSDPATDVALLKVDVPASSLTPIPLGSSANVKVGDGVVAIGNPFGLDRTVTSGIVSAISREIQAPNGVTAIRDAIQTDAAINHGNSGGPLINMQGEVIGINSQIETGGTTDGNVGIGFAVPIDMVKDVVSSLRADGVVKHAWLGVSLSPVDQALADRVDVGTSQGAMVATVIPGGPAASAGLQAATDQVVIDGETYDIGGDVIVSADGKPITEVRDLQDAVVGKKPGDVLKLGLVRADGSKAEVSVTLGDLATAAAQAQAQQQQEQPQLQPQP